MRTTSLLEVATLAPDRVRPWTGQRGYVATGDADDNGRLSPSMMRYDEKPSRADLTARPGDVLMARMAGTEKVFEVDGFSSEYVYSTGFAVLRPDPTKLDAAYLRHWLRTSSFQSAKNRYSAGATQRAITNAGMRNLTIPMCDLSRQRRVAAILDHADALRAKRRRVLTHLDSLAKSLFNDMFGNVAATSTVQAEASLVRTGPFGSQLLHSEFVDEGVAVLGLDNVVGNEFRWGERRFITPVKYAQLKRYTVKPGDVLISIMGTTGRCVVVPADIPLAINTKHICAITPKGSRIDSSFLRAAFLWHPDSLAYLRRQTKGSIMDGLNMGIVKAMPIPVPALADQQEFARRMVQLANWRGLVNSAVEAGDTLFGSLQSQAFRGEL